MLQGPYFTPSTFLCCLYDTRLEPIHIPVRCLPIYGVPVHLVVRGRTSNSRCHLLSLPDRFIKLSRNERPGGSLPTFVWDDVADVLAQSLFVPLQDDFRFFHVPLPAVLLAGLATSFPRGKTTGLPRSA